MSESRTVLLVGIEPDQVDFSDPDLPPGMNADRIRAGLVIAEQQFIDHGDQVDLCALGLDGSAEAVLVAQLTRADYDCVVIGGGLRRPAAHYLQHPPRGQRRGRSALALARLRTNCGWLR